MKTVIIKDRRNPHRTSTIAVARRKAGSADGVALTKSGHVAAMASLRQLVDALLAEGMLYRESCAPQSAFPARRSYRLGDSQWLLEVIGGRENLGVFQRFEEHHGRFTRMYVSRITSPARTLVGARRGER